MIYFKYKEKYISITYIKYVTLIQEKDILCLNIIFNECEMYKKKNDMNAHVFIKNVFQN